MGVARTLVRSRPGRRLAAALAALALVLAGAGCKERIAPPPAPGGPAVSMVLTRDFGTRQVATARAAPGQSAMAALQGSFQVETRYSGAYVQGIDGLTGSSSAGTDWLYFVNGVEADVGAASYDLHADDRVWWDHRRWHGRPSVGAVVGAWPEPFLHGYGGGAAPRVAADPPLAGALAAAGARVTAGDSSYRALVGSDADLRRRDPAWSRAASDPQRAGMTAWIADGAVHAWDGAAGHPVDVPGAVAVVAAVRAGVTAGDGVVLAVAGLDAAQARRAARQVVADPAALHDRYAVCLDPLGRPVCAGGMGTTG